jgi:tetratricopeptide (TPR) repeat protein
MIVNDYPWTSMRYVASAAASFLLVLVLGTAAMAQEDKVQSQLRLGAQAMHNGKPDEAERYFREVTRIAPQLADGYLDMGLAQLRQGKLTDAVESLNKSLQLSPNAAGAHMFLGIGYFQMNHLEQARAALRQEIDLNPTSAESLMWLGITELAAGNPEKAVLPLDKAAELAPKDINILDYRGRAHLLVSKNSYAQMYALDPGSWRVHRLSAQIFSESNQHKPAIGEYEAAVKLAPTQPDLYEELGDEYRKEGNLEAAQANYAKRLELTPHDPVAMYDLGSVFVEQGNAPAGVPLLKEAIKAFAKPTAADYYLGRGLAAMGQYPEATASLERATGVQQSNEVAKRAYYQLSQVYRKMQRTADANNALAEFQKLSELDARQSAQQLADWNKMKTGSGTEATVPTPPNP